jgi:hypothetical protein
MDAKMNAAKKDAPSELPAAECELLYGVAMIGRWMGMRRAQAKGLIDDGTLPTFHPPGRAARCALKSELNAVFQEWSRRR